MTVEQLRRIRAAPRRREISFTAERDVRAGDQVTHVSSMPGVIGVGVTAQDNTRLLLSCAHVLAPRDKRIRTNPELNIIASPPLENAESTPNRIGVLQKFTNFEKDMVYMADAAVAKLDDEVILPPAVIAGDRLTGTWQAPDDDADFRGRKVWRINRHGQRTEGVLVGYDAQEVSFPDGDKVEFESVVRYETTSDSGDSGGAVVDVLTGKLVGLHFAGDKVKHGLICLASIIFPAFGLRDPIGEI
jgi:hypothetical protein